MKITTRNMSRASLFALIIAIASQISIPTFFVPITLQVFAVVLTALTLPRKEAMLAVSLYIVIGLLGLPVFASGTGGLGALYKPSFGFILGFIPLCYVVSRFKDIQCMKFPYLSLILGTLVLYGIGLSYVYVYLRTVLSLEVQISDFLMKNFLIFMPTDILSYFLANYAAQRIRSTRFKAIEV